MPHDAHGNPLQVGDRVVIPGTVTFIGSDGDYCNCNVETEHAMPGMGNGTKTSLSGINTRQIEQAFTIGVSVPEEERGKSAYAGYCAASDGKSLISGQALPGWDALPTAIQRAWTAAGNAVRDRIFPVERID